MTSDGLYLGLDFGTESVRAVLVGAAGAIAAESSVTYRSGQIVKGSQAASRFPRPLPAGWVLQDPGDWTTAAHQAVQRACEAAGTDDVRGIGVAFTSCTVLPAWRDGTPLTRSVVYERRPHAWPKLWKHHGARTQAERMTAVARERGEPWLARYGGVVGLEWFFPKLLEVLDGDPDVAATADVWVEAGDWLVWRLTGANGGGGDARDRLVRSTCQAGYKALWSREDGYPSPDYLAACDPRLAGVADRCLAGALAAPGTAAGRLSDYQASLFGLRPGIPVSAAVIDAHAAVPGAGVGGPGTLVMVLGTSGCHMVMSPQELLVPGLAGVVADGILPGLYGYETGQAALGDALDWARRLCGEQDHRRLEAAARLVAPGSDGLHALDWFNGCRTPLMDGGLHGAILGVDLHHGPEHLYRAVLEACSCGLAWIVETLREGGVAVERFVATGGLAHRNGLLAEIVASTLDAPVHVPATYNASALGAAVYGALAAGRFPDAATAVDRMTGRFSAQAGMAAVVEPTPDAAAYREVYARYRAAASSHSQAATGDLTYAPADMETTP